MRIGSRLSAIVMLVFAAVASPTGERASARTTVPASGIAAPAASGTSGRSSEPRAQEVRSLRADAHQSQASRADVERAKTFAWLLLLLHEQQGAR